MKASGKTVLITGGGSGIGLALAQTFLKNKNTVIITGRNLNKLQKAQKANPGLHIVQNDVTNEKQIKELVQKVQNEFGGLDVLVNNAGVLHTSNVQDSTYPFEKHLQEIDIDMAGPIRMVHYFLPQLLKKPEAAIINVSSGLAFIPLTMAPVYSATKAGLHAWTQSIRLQLKETNVKVIELMPPVVDTEMVTEFEEFPKISSEKLADAFWKGYRKNQKEITPGISKQLKLMRRLAPGFIFNQINKQAVPA